MERAARGGAEERLVVGQCAGHLGKQVGALQELAAAITIGKPRGGCRWRAGRLLQAEHIGLGVPDIGDKFLTEPAAPAVQR